MSGTEVDPPIGSAARHLAMAVFSLLSGAISGWLAHWPAALLEMRLTGAGYSDTAPHWDPHWATFSATYHGAPFGAVFGLLGYLIFLRRLRPTRVISAVPMLFAATLAGALVGSPFAGTQLLLAAGAFFCACSYIAQRDADRPGPPAELGAAGDVRPSIAPE